MRDKMCANENEMSYYTNQFQAEIQFELPINVNNAKSFLYLYKNIFIFISLWYHFQGYVNVSYRKWNSSCKTLPEWNLERKNTSFYIFLHLGLLHIGEAGGSRCVSDYVTHILMLLYSCCLP